MKRPFQEECIVFWQQNRRSILTILIIGSKGFIGSHAIAYFKGKGHSVFGCDVVVDYEDKQYFLVDATVTDFREIFENNAFDACINCSGAASVPESIQNPRRDFELNTSNVFKLLDAIRKYRPTCKFIQLSSAAVYGNPAYLPINETMEAAPVSPYGWHKLYSEQICRQFVQFYNIPVVIVRPFSVFGRGLKKQIFWDVYQKITKGYKLELFGTGKETRDFIHVNDLMLVIDLILQHGQFKAEIYNAANGVATSIEEVIGIFCGLQDHSVTYSFNGQIKPGDPLFWQADVSKILALGYRQQVTNTKGLKDYIQWTKELG
jgi:dTDP-glucose 4,6-dehydratase/UDP-glucose 4-epimerase